MRVVSLLSAGLDSAVNTWYAKRHHDLNLVLTVDYGQRAASAEIRCASKIASYLNVDHKIIDLKWFREIGKSALLDEKKSIPIDSEVAISNLRISHITAEKVWVPNRNGVLMNIAGAFAESIDADAIVVGFNKEEAATFPDNTQDFLNQTTSAFTYSTRNKVKAISFTTDLHKNAIVKMGMSMNVDWSMIWPCYFNGNKWCGQCESCQRSLRALNENGISIPLSQG